MATTYKQMVEKLAELNDLRKQRGIDPIKYWRASYESLLDAIEESKKQLKANQKAHKQIHGAKVVAVYNEEATGAQKAAKKAAKGAKADKSAKPDKPAKTAAPAKAKTAAAAPAGPIKDAVSFNAALKNREGTNQAKLAAKLYDNLGKPVRMKDLAKAVYGDPLNKAISNVVNGFVSKVRTIKGFDVEREDETVTLTKS